MNPFAGSLTLANVFTTARLVLIPIFGFLWMRGRGQEALVVFLMAAVTDLLDGFVARYFNQMSRLGAVLDPAADKFLLLVGYVAAARVGAVPVWVAILVIGRDVIIAGGALLLVTVLKGRMTPADWRPSRLGKYTMFAQSTAVALALLLDVYKPDWGGAWLPPVVLVASMLTLASGIQYVLIAIRALLRGAEGAKRKETA